MAIDMKDIDINQILEDSRVSGVNYEDLPLTSFPTQEDNWARMSDVTASLMGLVTQYNSLYAQQKFDECNQLLQNNPQLLQTIFNADKWNKIRDGIISLQRFFLEEVEQFIYNVANNTVGINNDPNKEESKTTAYSSGKVDEIIDNVVAMINETINFRTVNLQASKWSGSSPFTQTVALKDITGADSPIISLYLTNSDNASTVKAKSKAYGYIDRATTADGSITFYCYQKKPAVDFAVAVKGV